MRDQVLCTRYTAGGDSGAAVFNSNNQIVGLHFAGTPSTQHLQPHRQRPRRARPRDRDRGDLKGPIEWRRSNRCCQARAPRPPQRQSCLRAARTSSALAACRRRRNPGIGISRSTSPARSLRKSSPPPISCRRPWRFPGAARATPSPPRSSSRVRWPGDAGLESSDMTSTTVAARASGSGPSSWRASSCAWGVAATGSGTRPNHQNGPFDFEVPGCSPAFRPPEPPGHGTVDIRYLGPAASTWLG